MCDTKKYYKIYQEIKKLAPDDTLQLVEEAKTKEEKDFFQIVGNYLLQLEQQKIIEGELF